MPWFGDGTVAGTARSGPITEEGVAVGGAFGLAYRVVGVLTSWRS